MSLANLSSPFAQQLRETIGISQKLLDFYAKLDETFNGPFTNTAIQNSLISQAELLTNLQAEINQGVLNLQNHVSAIVAPTL